MYKADLKIWARRDTTWELIMIPIKAAKAARQAASDVSPAGGLYQKMWAGGPYPEVTMSAVPDLEQARLK